jgi:hypothetical protein
MVVRGTIGRFARWGFTHGPAWGTLAAVIGGIPVAALVDANVDGMRIVLIGALAGLLAGPVLGAVVGVVCVAADRAPKWILDAPDYVAVLAVVTVVGGVMWPVLGLGRSGVAVGALGIVLLTCVPAIDAARSAPRLLYRAEVRPSPIEVSPGGHAS